MLLGIRDAATPLISSADSVLVARSREHDLAELPAVLGAGYDAALQRGRALVAASPDRVLAAALRVLDEAADPNERGLVFGAVSRQGGQTVRRERARASQPSTVAISPITREAKPPTMP